MMTTARLNEETLKRLNQIKGDCGFSSVDAVILALLNNSNALRFILKQEVDNGEKDIS